MTYEEAIEEVLEGSRVAWRLGDGDRLLERDTTFFNGEIYPSVVEVTDGKRDLYLNGIRGSDMAATDWITA